MTSCSCSCECDETAVLYEAIERTARVRHWCCECGDTIEPKQRYEHVSSLYDGAWSHFDTCELCCRIRDDLCGFGFCHGELRQSIWDCLEFDYITGEEKPPCRSIRAISQAQAEGS